MKGIFLLVGLVAVLCSGLGCQTTGWEQQRHQDARAVAEVAELRISMQRMEHRLADLVREQEVLGRDVQTLQHDVRQQSVRNEAALSALSGRIDEQGRSQAAMRQELTNELSARMEAILRAQTRTAPAAPRGAGTRPRPEVGYEHEVQAGETLSEIARAYGVTSQDIVNANQMRDPNVLRVGQKLFIPERSR
ncbi:MAG: LysM peptidoglycan-binding domain-containing protein [Kiritimatiellia bacterium]